MSYIVVYKNIKYETTQVESLQGTHVFIKAAK